MRLFYDVRTLSDTLYRCNKVVYGRIYKGTTKLIEILNKSEVYHRICYSPMYEDFQGWMHLRYTGNVVPDVLCKIAHDIIYIYDTDDGLYDLNIIRKARPGEFTCDREYYKNLKKSKVIEKIGMDYFGFIYYNDELDKDHSILNTFKLAFKSKSKKSKV